MPDGRIHCDAYAIWVPPEWGCIDHTDLDAPDDPRQVTGTAHGLPITEAADDGP